MTVPSPPAVVEPPAGRHPARRRLLVLASLVAVLALVGTACRQLDPENRAGVVPGVSNGNLPISYLASAAAGCVVYDEATASLRAMIAQAALDGVTLKPLSCYRDYAGQVAARDEWCARGACQMAAVPGTSNHGWGKAVDFRDQSGELTFDSAGYLWLKTWAGHYGWIHPKVMEPGGPVPEAWHWEWIGDGGKMYPGEYFGIGNAPLATPRGLPFGVVDEVAPVNGGVSVKGWAIDPDQVASIPVHVYVDSDGYAITADASRPDVKAAFPLVAGADHGYEATVPAAPGPHQVCVYAINASGTGYNVLLGCRTVTVAAPAVEATTPTTPPPTPTTSTSSTTTAVAVPSSSTSTTSTTSTAATAGAPIQGSSTGTR